jgi:ankyrin repeat protein
MGGKELLEMAVAVLRKVLWVLCKVFFRKRGVPSEAVMTMLECGMSFQQMERVWMGLGGGIGAFRGECENILCSENTVTPRHKASLGLELLLRGSPSDVAAVKARVIFSLREQQENPPERFRDPVSYALMDDPVMIETGHVFDRSSVFDARGELRSDACPMTRHDIERSVYPAVFLRRELIEHKEQRFDAVIAAARGIAAGPARNELLSVAEALLACLGSGLYIHQAAAYWELKVDLVDGENAAGVLWMLAVKESVWKLDSNVPVRALFDRLSAKLGKSGAVTWEDVDEMLLDEAMSKEDLLKKLESAIFKGGVKTTRLRAKYLLESQDANGETLLFTAAEMGLATVVRALVEAGADVNTEKDDGVTPLYIAARDGHDALVRALIEVGADVNKANDDGVTPLYMAAYYGHEAVMRALIEAGADINKAIENGATALYIAAESDCEAMVRALIEAGADVNKASDDGTTPLYVSTQEGHDAVVRVLIVAGADINKATDNGATPLIIAAVMGCEAMVRGLIEAGADVNKARVDGVTPMYFAAQEGHEAVVRLLIEAGADVSKARDDGSTPLHMAAHNGHEAIVRELIELGEDVNKAEDDGCTPLFTAAQNGHETVVRALIEAGAGVNQAEDGHMTPLFIAAQIGHEALIRALIELGADISKTTRQQMMDLRFSF